MELMADLERRAGGPLKAAAQVGVSPQTWSNWKRRGLPEDGELRVWLALAHPRILSKWMDTRRLAHQAAA